MSLFAPTAVAWHPLTFVALGHRHIKRGASAIGGHRPPPPNSGNRYGCLCVCVLRHLPMRAGLILEECSFPVAALPGMRFHMLHLTHLALDLQACEPVDGHVLEPLLVLLCRPHGGATPLRHLEVHRIRGEVNGAECKRAALEHLERAFGVTGVTMRVAG